MAQEPRPRTTGRARAPRVQIAYNLPVGGEDRRKELPFVIGVLGDFAGNPDPTPAKLRDRKFSDVTRGNLNAVLKSLGPRLTFTVPNRLGDAESGLAVTLRFESLEDFEPEQVARQIGPLRRLIELRGRLSALRAALWRDDALQQRFREVAARRVAAARGNGAVPAGE
jgi:type VI secretion system protein ImpB